jgi:hypothetical protein
MASKSSATTNPGTRARQAQRAEATESFMKELSKERAARAEKTARLKALRLAKEAADLAAAEAEPPAAKTRPRTKPSS